MAAHKLAADIDGTLLFFSKENFSNGCINTVDVFYPSAPLFLLMNPKLLRGVGASRSCSTRRWRAGAGPMPRTTWARIRWPTARSTAAARSSEDRQMPVEESGNMLLLAAALAQAEGNASLARKYWPLLTKWAEYLRDKGLDPENQLCTDDFAGHLAHNANLSIKAILAIGGYAMLADGGGKQDEATKWQAIAHDYAGKWMKLAADGDHYRARVRQRRHLEPEVQPGVGPPARTQPVPGRVARQEIAYYLKKQNRYGLPLDNRKPYTKLDWIYWTATMAENQADFQALIAPTWKFANESEQPRPAHRLVLDAGRQAARLPGAQRGRRPLHQDAGRPGDVEEVVGAVGWRDFRFRGSLVGWPIRGPAL